MREPVIAPMGVQSKESLDKDLTRTREANQAIERDVARLEQRTGLLEEVGVCYFLNAA